MITATQARTLADNSPNAVDLLTIVEEQIRKAAINGNAKIVFNVTPGEGSDAAAVALQQELESNGYTIQRFSAETQDTYSYLIISW